jgi:hypothetical protein
MPMNRPKVAARLHDAVRRTDFAAYQLGDADRHPHRPPVMALAPEQVDRLEELHRQRVADATTDAGLDDVWNGLIEPYVEADWFDSEDTFDRFQRVDDEACASIRNRNRNC